MGRLDPLGGTGTETDGRAVRVREGQAVGQAVGKPVGRPVGKPISSSVEFEDIKGNSYRLVGLERK